MNNGLRGRYSPMETTVFKALREQGAATSEDLIRKVYPRKAIEPFNAQIIVNRAATTLGRKLERNGEVFRLQRRRLPRQHAIENRLIKKESRG